MSMKKILIVSEPRTGSNNLTYCLSAHPQVELGNELLHPVNGWTRSQAGLPNPTSADDPVFEFPTADSAERSAFLNAVFSKYDGFKVHTEHSSVDDILAIAVAYDCLIVRCTRRAIFEQAISNYVAMARSVWHANEAGARDKLEAHKAGDIDPGAFMRWIHATWSRRTELSRRLADSDVPFCSIEYETFFSSPETGIVILNEIFALSGRHRLGELDNQEEKDLAYASALSYLDPARQKLTPQDDWADLLTNLSELERRFAKWQLSAQPY